MRRKALTFDDNFLLQHHQFALKKIDYTHVLVNSERHTNTPALEKYATVEALDGAFQLVLQGCQHQLKISTVADLVARQAMRLAVDINRQQ